MHMLIAFCVIAAITFFPALWINAMANSFTYPSPSGWLIVGQAMLAASAAGLLGALVFGGLWEAGSAIVSLIG